MNLITFFLADPNDPLLDRFKNNTAAKKFEPSAKSLSTSSLVPPARPRISSPTTSVGHKDIRSPVGAKVTPSEKKRIKNRQLAANKVSLTNSMYYIITIFFQCIAFMRYFYF